MRGDEEQTKRRWWPSLRESHTRFRIGAAERGAWLKHMTATLDATPLDETTRAALRQFFEHSSSDVIGEECVRPEHEELTTRWDALRALDDAVAAIVARRDPEAMVLVQDFSARPSVFVGLLARMIQSGRPGLIAFAVNAVKRDPSLAVRRYGGRALLHYASGAGCLELVEALLRLGADPNMQDDGGHTPLYRAANQCASATGPEVVRALVRAGANVNTDGGVTRATPLHMAARRGHVEIAQALLDCGAAIDARDALGDTPLRRSVNCNKIQVASLLVDRGADIHSIGNKALTPLRAARTGEMKRLLLSCHLSGSNAI